jgi:LysM repeat protein
MNNPNPFVPKGSLLEQQSQRRFRLKLAVGCILAVSVTGLVAMLIVGCKRENPDVSQTSFETNTPPAEMANPPVTETNPPLPAPPVVSNTAPVFIPSVPPPVQPPVPPSQATETTGSTYEVVSGDTLAKIAKAHGVTLKALEAANPGVDPKKLHPKQKLNIPAPAAPSATTQAAPGAGATEAGGGESYTVKSGDTLAKIAKNHGVGLKALRAANPKFASTDHIHVGDKLTIPAKAEAVAPAAPATPAPDASAAPVAPAMQMPPPTPTTTPAH